MIYKIFVIIILILLIILINTFKNKKSSYLIDTFKNEKFPPILKFDNVFTLKECNEIINFGKDKLYRSKLGVDNDIGIARTSSQTWITKDALPCIERCSKFVSKLTGLPVENQEKWQLLKYEQDQEYKPHYDACSENTDEYSKCIKTENDRGWGKRLYTFFIYLNDVEEGGETYFTKLNKMYKPKHGTAIFWHNLTEDQKKAHPYSEHAGMPVKKGIKWAINVWIRQKPER